ncbi:transglutaminase domain-containing protein [Microbacterium sp. Sa4CUA7]|uniref:Transglutaminase domain-containing protein n=2 Tax=Microbacterium pullorum TaxID=2762236 RepID=A0ABR8RZK3_9MICO|nr:transglutaminase domain-containing protein [Microbacterium pullorum]
MGPLLRVIEPGSWLAAGVLLAGLVLAAGYLAHRGRLPAVAVSGIQLLLWAVFLTACYLPDTALLWIFPTPETIREAPGLLAAGMNEIVVGTAPLSSGEGLTLLLVGAIGLFAIVLDHVVVTARMPLLAVTGVVAVWLVPALAAPSGMDVVSFAFLAAAILFLLRAETRTRETPGVPSARPTTGQAGRPAERRAGVGATAVGIGAMAIVVAITVTPLLPTPTMRPGAGGGLGAAATINPSLNLGEDLRRLTNVPVLYVRSNAPQAPYLRVVTLSSFDGSRWLPDHIRTLPLEGSYGFGELRIDESLRVTAYRTTVEVTNLASAWLPVAFPAVAVEGLEGDWEVMPFNRTVVSRTANSQGQSYEVQTHVPRPTREQIRASHAGGTVLRDATYALPDVPMDQILQAATAVTAGAENDYDRLIALQSWFRGDEFTYSLDAPVADGFDGSGIEAIEQFVAQKEGYCVHFASAFAVMARLMDMPARIVVGYLPGTGNGSIVEGQVQYQVTSDQLHAWPEVHFDGIGWVPFEPTKSLGTPTSFLPERVALTDDAGEDLTGGVAEPVAPSASIAPTDPAMNPDRDDQALSGPASPAGISLTGALTAVAVLLVLTAPALLREVVRRRRLAAAARGDAAAAWLGVREAAVDLGIPVPAAESPRAFGARLVAEYDAPAGAVSLLVTAIERVSYAPEGGVAAAGGSRRAPGADATADAAMSNAVSAVTGALSASQSRGRRLLATLVPRSLIVRPGSAYAAARVPV